MLGFGRLLSAAEPITIKQDIRIVFTQARKKRSVNDIVKELSEFIDAHICDALPSSPLLLIGKSIRQRFEREGTCEEMWYNGKILVIVQNQNYSKSLMKMKVNIFLIYTKILSWETY